MKNPVTEQYKQLVKQYKGDRKTQDLFLQRLDEGKITRDENTASHFCVYFAAHDPSTKQVFLGHHKKSGLWLFNGGHVDRDELANDAVIREAGEEWGIALDQQDIGDPFLLTITPISIPPGYPCKVHYDIWYGIAVDQQRFHPDQEKLAKEFFTTKWVSVPEAAELAKDNNTHKALDLL